MNSLNIWIKPANTDFVPNPPPWLEWVLAGVFGLLIGSVILRSIP